MTVITEDDIDDLLYPRTIGIMMKLHRMREKERKRNEEVRKNGHISPMDILVEVAVQDMPK